MAEAVKDPGGEGDKKVGPKKGLTTGKNKWYLVGGLGLIAILVFVFVRKSNANDAGGSTTTGARQPLWTRQLRQRCKARYRDSQRQGTPIKRLPARKV